MARGDWLCYVCSGAVEGLLCSDPYVPQNEHVTNCTEYYAKLNTQISPDGQNLCYKREFTLLSENGGREQLLFESTFSLCWLLLCGTSCISV